jgi:hypothetical protein
MTAEFGGHVIATARYSRSAAANGQGAWVVSGLPRRLFSQDQAITAMVLAAWSLGAGIVATVGANLAHGVGHGLVGALVSAWPALALVGSFELLMMLIRSRRGTRAGDAEARPRYQPAPPLAHDAPLELSVAPTLEQAVRARHEAGQSQRAIARELKIDRRKVKRMIDQVA